MPYRTMKPAPQKPEDKLPVFSVHNGADNSFGVPCFYLEVEPPERWHDYHLHDHIGWPSPKHPDHICQMPIDFPYPYSREVFQYVDMDKAEPIHWKSNYENYDDNEATRIAYLTFDQADKTDSLASGVYVTDLGEYTVTHACTIRDVPEDHVIDIDISIDGPAFNDKPQRLLFTLFTALDKSGVVSKREVVLRGWLEILPSASYSYVER